MPMHEKMIANVLLLADFFESGSIKISTDGHAFAKSPQN
jgi:hypothetical protein